MTGRAIFLFGLVVFGLITGGAGLFFGMSAGTMDIVVLSVVVLGFSAYNLYTLIRPPRPKDEDEAG